MKKDQASSTAFTVAQGVLYIAKHTPHARLVSDEMKTATQQILSATEEGQRRLRLLQSVIFPRLVPLIERLTLPGITLNYVLRKSYIQTCVQQAIDEGAQQVIVLGAGFDTLAFRYAKKYPEVNFIEIDHPATHIVKREALESATGQLKNLHFIPVDFTTQRLEDVLSASPLAQPELPTVITIEGVLMYLTVEQVQHLFASLPIFLHNGRRVVFTATNPGATTFGPLLRIYLKLKAEPLKWTCDKNEMEAFVNAAGYEFKQLAGVPEFKEAFFPNDSRRKLNEVEYVAVADKDWATAP